MSFTVLTFASLEVLSSTKMTQLYGNTYYFKAESAVPVGAWTFTPPSAIIPVTIDQNYDDHALRIDTEATTVTKYGIYMTCKMGAFFQQDISNGYAMWCTRNMAEAGTYPLINFYEVNANSTNPVLYISNAGSGYGMQSIAAGTPGVWGESTKAGAGVGVYGTVNHATNFGVYGIQGNATNGSVAVTGLTAAGDNNYGFFTADNISAANKGAFISDVFINQDSVNLKPGDLVKLSSDPIYFEPYKNPRIPVSGIVLSDKDDDIEMLGVVAEPAGPQMESTDDEKDFTDNESTEIKPGGRVYVPTCGTFAHCKVDTSYGAIKRGYRLTSSKTKGCARVADVTVDKFIFARALEEVAANSGIKYISILASSR